MIINDFTKVFLILHRLDENQKRLIDVNLSKLHTWYLESQAILVVAEQNITPLMAQITEGLADPGKVTFIEVGRQIYTVLRKPGVDVEIAFEPPKNK